MKKFSLLIFPVVALILILGCSGKEEEADNQETDFQAERNVRVAEAVRKDIYSGITTTGRIESEVYVNVTSSLPGKIERIHVREGMIVRQGDLLVELDDVNLVQAEQHYLTLERNYQRMTELFRNDAIDQQSYEEIAAAYQIAKRNYEYTMENTRIESPIEGKVVSLTFKEGEVFNAMISPYLIKILSLNQMKAVSYLSDKDFIKTQTGMKAIVRIDAMPEKRLEGYISFISTEAERITGTFRCEVIIDDKSDLLRHNQFARVFIAVGQSLNTIVVPQEAIVNENRVFIVENGKAKSRTVEQGIASSEEIEILRGVYEGEQVIVVGNTGLTDGYPVRVID